MSQFGPLKVGYSTPCTRCPDSLPQADLQTSSPLVSEVPIALNRCAITRCGVRLVRGRNNQVEIIDSGGGALS